MDSEKMGIKLESKESENQKRNETLSVQKLTAIILSELRHSTSKRIKFKTKFLHREFPRSAHVV